MNSVPGVSAPGEERSRPRVALAMRDTALRDALFSPRLRDRLFRVADCDYDVVIQDFGAIPDDELARIEVLLTGWHAPRVDAEALERMPNLRLIAHAGGAVKGHVDPVCWTRGVSVTTAALANAIPVAEFALAQILLAGKFAWGASRLYYATRRAVDREVEFPTAGNYEKTVGLVGASRIGRLVLRHLKDFGMDVVVFDPTVDAEDIAALGARKVELDELMRSSDIVSLHAPVLSSTIGMIGRQELASMRSGATLVNTARGALVDHSALREELMSGRLNAALDVTTPEPLPPDDPLFGLPNVVLTPHMAGSTGAELHRMTDLALTEIERLASGRALVHPVRLDELGYVA